MLTNYLKLAYRVLLRRKFFTFISLFGTSITLLVLMIAAALLDHIFGAHPPETKLDRTLGLYTVMETGKLGGRSGPPGYRLLDKYVRTLPDVENVSVLSVPSGATITAGTRALDGYLKSTDAAFWEILDFRFVAGQPFTRDDHANGRRVAVINRATASKLFGDAPAVGQSVDVNAMRFRVVGVVENVPLTRLVPFSDVWIPTTAVMDAATREELIGRFFGLVLARSRDDLPRIKNEFAARLRTVPVDDPKRFDTIHGGLETMFESFSRMLLSDRQQQSKAAVLRTMLIAMAAAFMLLPALNLISINLSRVFERSSEIGVRKAFGASSGTLVGQFVVENVVLTIVGGIVGFALSALVLAAVNSTGIVPYAQFSVNFRVFAFGMLAALFFGILSGVWPAWRMSRLHPVIALRGGSR